MALSTSRNLADLEQTCQMLGVQATPTRKLKAGRDANNKQLYKYVCSKTDYVLAIRQYYIDQMKQDGRYTHGLDFLINHIEQPQLAKPIIQLKPEDAAKIKAHNNEYIYQEKIDGCRMLAFYDKGTNQFEFFSRNNSVTDFLPIPYKDNIVLPEYKQMEHSFCLDCEIVVQGVPDEETIKANGLIADTQLSLTTSLLALNSEDSRKAQETIKLKFMTFDCIYIDDENLMDIDYINRLKVAYQLVDLCVAAGLPFEKVRTLSDCNKKEEFLQGIFDEGGEGVVAKYVRAKYNATGNRNAEVVKIKRTLSNSALMSQFGDTGIDAFIIGYTDADPDKAWSDKIGGIKLGMYLADDNGKLIEDEQGNPKIHWIATCSGLTEEQRNDMTEINQITGKPELAQKYYGQVVTFQAQDLASKALRGTHSRIVGWRPDRSADTCIIQESLLKTLVH